MRLWPNVLLCSCQTFTLTMVPNGLLWVVPNGLLWMVPTGMLWWVSEKLIYNKKSNAFCSLRTVGERAKSCGQVDHVSFSWYVSCNFTGTWFKSHGLEWHFGLYRWFVYFSNCDIWCLKDLKPIYTHIVDSLWWPKNTAGLIKSLSCLDGIPKARN